MDNPQFTFDKNQIGALVAKAYAAASSALRWLASRFSSSKKAPDDFATRQSNPSWEEYEAASNADILNRMHRNPTGLLSEQPFIDTLINVRNAENNRKQTRHVVFGIYLLALLVIVLVFAGPPAPEPSEGLEQKQAVVKQIDDAANLLRQEFTLKLQSKDMEIKDLKRQISLLSQGQADLARQMKSIAKNASNSSSANPAANPAPVTKPRKPN